MKRESIGIPELTSERGKGMKMFVNSCIRDLNSTGVTYNNPGEVR